MSFEHRPHDRQPHACAAGIALCCVKWIEDFVANIFRNPPSVVGHSGCQSVTDSLDGDRDHARTVPHGIENEMRQHDCRVVGGHRESHVKVAGTIQRHGLLRLQKLCNNSIEGGRRAQLRIVGAGKFRSCVTVLVKRSVSVMMLFRNFCRSSAGILSSESRISSAAPCIAVSGDFSSCDACAAKVDTKSDRSNSCFAVVNMPSESCASSRVP